MRDVPAGTVISFYAGVKMTHPTNDQREWDECANAISLDDELVIDVPSPYHLMSNYRTTCPGLAHLVDTSLTTHLYPNNNNNNNRSLAGTQSEPRTATTKQRDLLPFRLPSHVWPY